MQLYQFYLPDELPEFDSYRVISITADVECLLKRIAALVPSHCNPGDMFNMTLIFIREGNLVGRHIPRGGLHTARELHVAHRYHWHSSRNTPLIMFGFKNKVFDLISLHKYKLFFPLCLTFSIFIFVFMFI
jgi:hypothetical protein